MTTRPTAIIPPTTSHEIRVALAGGVAISVGVGVVLTIDVGVPVTVEVGVAVRTEVGFGVGVGVAVAAEISLSDIMDSLPLLRIRNLPQRYLHG
jgi:hypothetical protein